MSASTRLLPAPRRLAARLFRPLAALALLGAAALPALAGEDVKIVRDDFGIPHIFSKTDEGVFYGMGYAQAEDRIEELLKNFRRAEGTMAEVFGKDSYQMDLVMRIVRHREIAQANYGKISERSRRAIEAFVAGINAWMKEHPDQVPAWGTPVEPWKVVALSRYIVYGWPLGDALDDLKAGGVSLMLMPYHGSNEWTVGPKRSAAGVPIALIDPHLSWYDEFRFYEARLYGDQIKVSGVSILGLPLPSLGHSQWCSVAMTTGSGDTADIFEEKLNPENKLQYEVDGKWRDMTTVNQKIGVKQADGSVQVKSMDIMYTHHGPIIAVKGPKNLAYSIAIPYDQSVELVDQGFEMMTAHNLAEMKKALSHLELMGQNVMVATVDGDIYYQRTGKVPIRPEGIDSYKPIPGWLSKNDWLGIHKMDDLVQIENPPQGYMQNCNCSPAWMMKGSTLLKKNYPAEVYGCVEDLRHQRSLMVREALDRDDKVTIEEALEIAMINEVFGAEKWQARLKAAWEKAPEAAKANADAAKLNELIAAWDRHSRPESTGAVAYLFWKRALPEAAMKDDPYGEAAPDSVTDAQLIEALEKGAKALRDERGGLEIPYGQIYRVGRKEADGSVKKSYPVGGGDPGGRMLTPRAISYSKQPDGTFVGHTGQTSTQVVLLTKPPQSWTVIPLGESDHHDSPHWDDQAEKLFSKGKMKSTFFMNPEALKAHTESEKVVVYPGK